MSYNGIGLTTARGSGTNGYVQKNYAAVRRRDRHDRNDKVRARARVRERRREKKREEREEKREERRDHKKGRQRSPNDGF